MENLIASDILTFLVIDFCRLFQVTSRPRTVLGGPATGGGYWGSSSRPVSPGGGDNGSETSSVMPPQTAPRPKSRADPTAKYNNLNYWRARKVTSVTGPRHRVCHFLTLARCEA